MAMEKKGKILIVDDNEDVLLSLNMLLKPYAFYTLIPDCDFRSMTRPGPPIIPLSSKISPMQRGIHELFPICLHRLTNKIRNYIR